MLYYNKKNPVELEHCETSSSYRVFYLIKLKPQKESDYVHPCPIYPIRNGSRKEWRFATDRGGLPGSCDPSRIVTDCLDRHTGSHVAKRDSGGELQVVYTYPWKSWRIVTIRDESPSWRGSRRSETAQIINSRMKCMNIPRSKNGGHKHSHKWKERRSQMMSLTTINMPTAQISRMKCMNIPRSKKGGHKHSHKWKEWLALMMSLTTINRRTAQINCRMKCMNIPRSKNGGHNLKYSHKWKERRTLMMSLTKINGRTAQIDSRMKCMNIPRSKKGGHKHSHKWEYSSF